MMHTGPEFNPTIIHMCPENVACIPCGVGPVDFRRRNRRTCVHCDKNTPGWWEKGKRVGSAACRTCYETVQARYLDRRCLADPCTHKAVTDANGRA